MKELFSIGEIAVMSGLSVRTIRSYLASGQLEGEKINGAWRFTEEQFCAFLRRDMVRQSVRAKAHGAIQDFLLTSRRQEAAVCAIWDQPVPGGGPEERLRGLLLERANALGVKCSYRYEGGMARAILEGPPEAVAALLAQTE